MVQRTRMFRGVIIGIVICLMAPYAWGQRTLPDRADEEPEAPLTEPRPVPPSPGAPIPAYPAELLGLLAPPTRRGQVTLIPSIAVSEEYNDNLFLNNQNRKWDLITGFSPAILLFADRATYRLTGGYTFTARVYERDSRLNNALEHQNFLLGGFYRATPHFTLTAFDSFVMDRNTNVVASQGFATGRQESWSNTFAPGMTWQMTPRTFLTVGATYTVLRFEGAGSGIGSDTYALQSLVGQVFTPRLTGILGYGFTYLDLLGQQENSTTHTPTLGLRYRVTPTLTGSVTGGPSITELGGETFVSPVGAASLVQAFQFGSASAEYTKTVSVAGGLGGPANIQTVSGSLTLTTLLRGLIVALRPAYSVADSVSNRRTGRVDARVLTLDLAVSYRIARFTSIFGAYTFLHQRTGTPSSAQGDVDQNRIRFGLQFGYPIDFD